MQTNLILFCDESINKNELHSAVQTLIRTFSLALQQVDSITLLPTYSSMNEIIKHLKQNTIIGVGKCESSCLLNVYNSIKNYYGSEPIKTNYGLYCLNNNKRCSVVDLVEGVGKLNLQNLLVIYNLNNVFYFSLFGLKYREVMSRLSKVDYIDKFDFSYYENCGICYLSFTALSGENAEFSEDFKRSFSKNFIDTLYCDEPISLQNCVEDLLPLRKEYFAFINLSKDCAILNYKLTQINNFNQFNKVILPEDVLKLNDFTSAREIIEKYNLSFIVVLRGTLSNAEIIVFDEYEMRKFDFVGKGQQDYNIEYLLNSLLHKIFIKLRKNALFFPQDSV